MKKGVALLLFLHAFSCYCQAQNNSQHNALRTTSFTNKGYREIPFEILGKCNTYDDNTTYIDTFNVCRIRSNGIKQLKVYEFPDLDGSKKLRGDSILTRHIDYDSAGYMVIKKPVPVCRNRACILIPEFECEDYNYRGPRPELGNKRITRKFKKYKMISRYDSSGYLIESTQVVRGLFKYSNSFGGSSNDKSVYVYSDDHKKVQIHTFESHWGWFPENSKTDIWELTYDNWGNLLSRRIYDCYDGKWSAETKYYYTY